MLPDARRDRLADPGIGAAPADVADLIEVGVADRATLRLGLVDERRREISPWTPSIACTSAGGSRRAKR
jgi:hypothetical protein